MELLKPETFAKSIQKLGEYYPKFELSENQMKTWYGYFQKYSYNEFMQMVKLYIEKNEFAPQSPRSLVKYYEEALRENFEKKFMSADEAWEEVRNGLRQYSLHHEHSEQDKFFKYLQQFPMLVTDAARQHLSELATLEVSDTFVGNAFKKTYNSLLNREVSQSVKLQLQLTSIDESLLLESKSE